MSDVRLKLDWCSHAAAKYAVEHWHYSRCMPASKLVKLGVWEDAVFVGTVVYGMGASPPLFARLKSWLDVERREACELCRVALNSHRTPVSRIVAISLKMLHKYCPGLRLVVSFADADQNHHGGIYQAGNWIYTGLRNAGHRDGYVIHGRRVHCRSMPALGLRNTMTDARARDPNATAIIGSGKHQYLFAFDRTLRERIQRDAQPYPKRAGSADSGTSDIQSEGGGASPTSALCSVDPAQ